MTNYPINRVLPKFNSMAEIEAHNRRQCEKIAKLAKTIHEVEEIAIDLSGHLPWKLCSEFREMAIDAWFDYNVNKICAEFAQ